LKSYSFKIVVSGLLTLLLFSMAVLPVAALLLPRGSAQSPSCPSNDILHFTAYGGSPTTFNILGAYNPPGFFTSQLQYKAGGYPEDSPLGVPQNYSTVADVITSNSNYTVWTIHIKAGQHWSDGSNITANDYVGEWNSNFGLNPGFDPQSLHTEVVSVKPLNASTVVFTLNASDARLPEKIDTVLTTVLYPQSFTSQGASFNGFGTAVADGPFYVSNYTAGSNTEVLLRNPYYNPLPQACEIIWNFVESESADATYIASGSSDLAPVVPSSVPSLLAIPNIHILDQPGGYYTALSYNITNYPYNVTAFRQALAYGINQSAIVQQAFDGYASTAFQAEGGVVNFSSWYNPSQVGYSYDMNHSLSLLSSIGIAKGSSGYLSYPNGTAITLTIWADTDVTMNSIAAQIVQSDLTQLGFKVSMQLTSTSTLIGYLFGNTYDAYNGGMVLHTSNAYFPGDPFYDAQPFPITIYIPQPFDGTWENPPSVQHEFQSNLSALTATSDPTMTRTYLNNIQAINAQYLPGISLAYGDNLFAYSTARFTNWPSSPNSYIFETYFWNDTALATIAPVGATMSSTTSTSPTSTPSTTSISSSTSSTSSPTTTQSSSSSSTTSSSSNLLLISVAVVVVVIIVVVAAVVLMRRKRT
jgi:ABC-type transport system substrate-binding protein